MSKVFTKEEIDKFIAHYHGEIEDTETKQKLLEKTKEVIRSLGGEAGEMMEKTFANCEMLTFSPSPQNLIIHLGYPNDESKGKLIVNVDIRGAINSIGYQLFIYWWIVEKKNELKQFPCFLPVPDVSFSSSSHLDMLSTIFHQVCPFLPSTIIAICINYSLSILDFDENDDLCCNGKKIIIHRLFEPGNDYYALEKDEPNIPPTPEVVEEYEKTYGWAYDFSGFHDREETNYRDDEYLRVPSYDYCIEDSKRGCTKRYAFILNRNRHGANPFAAFFDPLLNTMFCWQSVNYDYPEGIAMKINPLVVENELEEHKQIEVLLVYDSIAYRTIYGEKGENDDPQTITIRDEPRDRWVKLK